MFFFRTKPNPSSGIAWFGEITIYNVKLFMSSILPLCVSVTLGLSMAMADNAGLMSYTLYQKKSESPHKNRAYHSWSRCTGACLVSGPDIQYINKPKSDKNKQSVASAPATDWLTDFLSSFSLFLGQVLDYISTVYSLYHTVYGKIRICIV